MEQVATPHVGYKGGKGMLISIMVMGVVAMALLTLGYLRGRGEHVEGLKRTKDMVIEVFPLLVFAFIVAGMVQTLIPRETISRWIGKESGIRGILLGTVTGGIMPGGPYVNLPVAAGLLRAGAGMGTAVAFVTAWSLWAVSRLPMEMGIMGPRFTLIRLASTFFFPPIAGVIARTLFERS